MAKLFALNQIIMADDTVVPRNSVFDTTPEQAKQFDKLGAARPATADEIADAAHKAAIEDGTAYGEVPVINKAEPLEIPPTDADGDPKAAPKAAPKESKG